MTMDISGILNLIQDSRLVKTGADIKPLTEPRDVFYLKTGNVLEGEIVRSLPDKQVVFQTNGRALRARTNLPLNVGDRIQVEVQKTGKEILLKVLNRLPFVEAMVKQEIRPLLGALQRPISQVIFNLKAAIRAVLSSDTPLHDRELATLLNRLSTLLEELNIRPEGTKESPPNQGSGRFLPASGMPAEDAGDEGPGGIPPNAQDPSSLLKWIRDSGLEWENKVWQLFEASPQDLAESIKKLIQHDLKGLTQKIIDQLPILKEASQTTAEHLPETHLIPPLPSGNGMRPDEILPPVSGQDSTPSPSAAPMGANMALLAHHLEQLSQTLQVHQWINAIPHDANQPFYFQIPLALSDGVKPLDLFLYKKKRERKNSEAASRIEKGDFWVVFFLTLSTLGSLRIDLKTRRRSLTVYILTETDKAVRHISPFLPKLEKALASIGFQVEGTRVERAADGRVTPPDPFRNHPSMRGMVNVVA